MLIVATLSLGVSMKAQNWAEGISTQLSTIRTVEMRTLNDSLSLPVVMLGSSDDIVLSFDELDSDTRTLYYTLRHCNIDWQPSDLIDIEFYDGFNKVYGADHSMLSFNTTTDYIHYTLLVDVEPIKISGNYILTVYSADDESELLRRPFIVYEPLTGIKSRITRKGQPLEATQTLSLSIAYPMLKGSYTATELRAAVWQNIRPDTWEIIDQPTFVRQNELVYDNCKEFEAGNEYRWADNRSLKYNGINVAHIDFHDPYYHITLAANGAENGYYYHEDFNGMQYIEARDIYRPASYGADYNIVHFTLASQQNIGDVYVFGELANFEIGEENRMTYDETAHCYRLALMLKQGLHSFQYVTLDKSNRITTKEFDGCFADTENDYYIAVYYRSLSDTYDRIVGFKRHNSKRSINSFIH